MRYWIIGLLVLVGLPLLVFAGQILASETGEVVVLSTTGAEGEQRTRLWVVALDGVQYLRGQPGSGWYGRLLKDPQVRLLRDGAEQSYRAEPRADLALEINRLMREKYGWRDVYIEWTVGSRDDAVAVALLPAR